jgi:dihydrofolate reductase
MRRIIYDVAVSLDGFISAADNDTSAFPAEGDHVVDYLRRLQDYGTVIMGRATYEFGYAYGLAPGARAYPHMDHHIFSTGINLPDDSSVRVVRSEWATALTALRQKPGGDIYLCGGGLFAAFAAGHGMIDRLRLKRAPIVLGAGIPLFDGLQQRLALRLDVQVRHESGVIYEDYAVL